MADESPLHLGQKKKRIYWDWWRENPVELVLVVLTIVLFAAVPWQGCGISEVDQAERDEMTQQIEVIP